MPLKASGGLQEPITEFSNEAFNVKINIYNFNFEKKTNVNYNTD